MIHKGMVWVLLHNTPGVSDDLVAIYYDPEDAYEECEKQNDAYGYDISDYLSKNFHVEIWGVF